MHGGAPGSGGPMGSRNGNYKHGQYSADAVASRRFRPERNPLTGLRLTVLSLAVPRSDPWADRRRVYRCTDRAESFLRRQFVDQLWPCDLNGAPLAGNLHDYLSVDDVAMNLLQFRRCH